jgi:hypothetical protein
MSWILELYDAYNITYATKGKDIGHGWAGTACPFCTGTRGNHLGVHIESARFHCWRCGPHKADETIAALIGLSIDEARSILYQYRKESNSQAILHDQINHKIIVKKLKFPSGIGDLGSLHESYLARRNFDPNKLAKEWKLLGTGPVSYLDNIDFRFRILAPIIWKGKEVSFQTRDCTNKHTIKYLTCPINRELTHHKHILYGNQQEWSDVGICVEGITDVWRLGPKAFATFGIQFSLEQVLQIARHFNRVILLFDTDVGEHHDQVLQIDNQPARRQVRNLANKLKTLGLNVYVDYLAGDPAELTQDDADHLVRTLTRKV